MYYKQKKQIVIFFLCLLSVLFLHYTISQKIQVLEQNRSFLLKQICLATNPSYIYNEKQAIISRQIASFSEKISPLLIDTLELDYVFAENETTKYLVYFIEQKHLDALFISENEDCNKNNTFFFLPMLPKAKHNNLQVFINKENFYIRRDNSYICNAQLDKKSTKFSCHPESYYIDFSLIL